MAAKTIFSDPVEFRSHRNEAVTLVDTTVYNVLVNDFVILADDDAAGAAMTLNLPSVTAVGSGARISVKKLGNTATVTIDTDGSETIDGQLQAFLSLQFQSLTIVSDGVSAWYIL